MILSANAKPYAFSFDPAKAALLLSKFASTLAFNLLFHGIETIVTLILLQLTFNVIS